MDTGGIELGDYDGSDGKLNDTLCDAACGENGWCVAGPFVGWHTSSDEGATWRVDGTLDAKHNAFGQLWPADATAATDGDYRWPIMQPHFVAGDAGDGHLYFRRAGSSEDGSRHRRGCDVDIPWRPARASGTS